MYKFISTFTKSISLGIIFWAFYYCCFAQDQSNIRIWQKLISIEKDTSLSTKEKLPQVLKLKKQFEDQKLSKDSVYARIMHRIGLYEVIKNDNIATNKAIDYTLTAIRINSGGKKNNSPGFCLNSYANLANYYTSLHLYNTALLYYDSALIIREQFNNPEISSVVLRFAKARMLYLIGDYQKAIEELNLAVLKAKASEDSSILPVLLNHRAQSYIMHGRLQDALKDVTTANDLSILMENDHETINSMLLKADIFAKRKDFSKVLPLYYKGIKERLKTINYSQISDDYTDLGNFYLNDLKNYNKAQTCYFSTVKYAMKANDFERLSKGHINLELVSFYQHNYKEAELYCIKALEDLKVKTSNNILTNPTAAGLSSVGNKDLLLVILRNKTELLLNKFIRTNNTDYLSACLQTSLLADTLITSIRHEQSGEQSKLYWRDFTRELFTNAMEACYLANNYRLAFYFMEKSRAVLLNDQQNYLAALAKLPEVEALKERQFQIKVISEQQRLALMQSGEAGYEAQLSKYSETRADFEHHIKSLEKQYPAYYQYKYEDEVPALKTLQEELLKNKQSFIHYFMNDTVAYILGITPSNTQLLKLSRDNYNSAQLINFLKLCSFEPNSNNEYLSFASLSHLLYKLLFQPLKIPKERVVICPDNFLIPFEALCSDNKGHNFLINDYIFDYAYSARYLLKKYNSFPAKGDFIGFAPVSFKTYSYVADLKESDKALKKSSGHYNNSKLLTVYNATRHNFMTAVSGYTIVNVFSHALADTTENEPVLYMHDSVVHLSELQLLHIPATKLVVLSACQTNVGKSAKGEGILSLARGFALAGIPSVAATLWQADEQSIYTISEKFHDYLSKGMRKDEALQKAKLHFIRNGVNEKPFPYYWANMILVGNQEPIKLSKDHHIWWWIAGIISITAVIIFMVQFLKKH